MYAMCPYCTTDTGGNHQPGYPNNPMKIIHQEPSQTIYIYKGTKIVLSSQDRSCKEKCWDRWRICMEQ